MFRNNKGMSLVETTVAFFILTTVTLTANSFMVSAIKNNATIKTKSEATQFGNKVLEKIIMKPYGDIIAGHETHNSQYKCSWVVIDSTELNMKTINLTVSWPVEYPKDSITLSTILAQ